MLHGDSSLLLVVNSELNRIERDMYDLLGVGAGRSHYFEEDC